MSKELRDVVPKLVILGLGIFVVKKILERAGVQSPAETLFQGELALEDREGANRSASYSAEACANADTATYLPPGCDLLQVTGYKRGSEQVIEVKEIPGESGMYLQKSPVDVWSKFVQMKAAAARDGVPLDVNSAFRTNTRQAQLYREYQMGTGNVAARPGYSNHQMGLAVDIQVRGRPSVLSWLRNNATDFGFDETVPNDTLHWEYTG